jgi:predicted O-methyltransferase YrrM
MAEVAREVIGIEIAESMRKLLAENLQESGVGNVRVFPTVNEALGDPAVRREAIDWVNSYIVFQHIPPERGLRILWGLLSVLAPGGWVSLHFNVFRDGRHWTGAPRFLQKLDGACGTSCPGATTCARAS